MTQPLLAFVHIEKAAGTTLIYLLRRNYLLRYLDVRPLRIASHGVFTAQDLRTCLRINPFLQCIGGHAVKPFSDLEHVRPDIRYVTLLRDPVERYLSQYRYWVTTLAKDWSFEHFLDHEPSHNFQTHKVAGADDVVTAKRVLAERFFVVGVAEYFDEFLVTLQQKLQPASFDPAYERRNESSTRSREAAHELFARHADRIRANNASDIELYRYVTEELLPRQKADCKADFDVALTRLRTSNGGNGGHRAPLLLDGLARKLYYEPLSGVLRWMRGMPMRGSY